MSYSIREADHRKKHVWIVDNDDGLSVTNDAERVCKELHDRLPDYRIFYRDTMGLWDELVHKAGVFEGFAPGSPEIPAQART